MDDKNLETYHKEHLELYEEHRTWDRELQRWKFDQRGLEQRLHRMEELLREHALALEAHDETLREMDLHIARHEALMSRQARGEPGDGPLGVEAEHRRARMSQPHVRVEHEQLAQLHRKLMFEAWRLLHGAGDVPETPPAREPSPSRMEFPEPVTSGRIVASAGPASRS